MTKAQVNIIMRDFLEPFEVERLMGKLWDEWDKWAKKPPFTDEQIAEAHDEARRVDMRAENERHKQLLEQKENGIDLALSEGDNREGTPMEEFRKELQGERNLPKLKTTDSREQELRRFKRWLKRIIEERGISHTELAQIVETLKGVEED